MSNNFSTNTDKKYLHYWYSLMNTFCQHSLKTNFCPPYTESVRENQLSARKTIPIRLTFGIRRTKNIVRITCGTRERDATCICLKRRLFALDTKYTICYYSINLNQSNFH